MSPAAACQPMPAELLVLSWHRCTDDISAPLGCGLQPADVPDGLPVTNVMGARRVTPTALVIPISASVAGRVAEHPDAVGHVSRGYLGERATLLAIDGMQPTRDNAGPGQAIVAQHYGRLR